MLHGMKQVLELADLVDQCLNLGTTFSIKRKDFDQFVQALEFNGIYEFKVLSHEKEDYVKVCTYASEQEANRIQNSFEALIFEG